eukprot:1946264-Amphidinium_carterae.1
MEQDGETIPLLTLAAQMYTMVFPAGLLLEVVNPMTRGSLCAQKRAQVKGVDWGSDHQMRFTNVKGFSSDAAGRLLGPTARIMM